jgi:hypothetical protein
MFDLVFGVELIHGYGSYKHPEPDMQHRIMPFYDYSGEITAADETEIPEDFSYHRQYSNDEITTGNIDNDTNMNDEIPVQYILRSGLEDFLCFDNKLRKLSCK